MTHELQAPSGALCMHVVVFVSLSVAISGPSSHLEMKRRIYEFAWGACIPAQAKKAQLAKTQKLVDAAALKSK